MISLIQQNTSNFMIDKFNSEDHMNLQLVVDKEEDDTILFLSHNHVKFGDDIPILHWFEVILGLHVNLRKSSLVSINNDGQKVGGLVEPAGCDAPRSKPKRLFLHGIV